MSSQSTGLSVRHTTFRAGGNSLTDDSVETEKTLEKAITLLIIDMKKMISKGDITFKKKITTHEMKEILINIGITVDPIVERDSKTFITPDGGFVFWEVDGEKFPILIAEDKYQGTNDKLFAAGKKKQATGNAIERYAKNVRACYPLFMSYDIFPYALFCAGCDFHSSETIAVRISSSNLHKSNHYVDISEVKQDTRGDIIKIVDSIDINKVMGIDTISVFVKGHKWDKVPHGTSKWTVSERYPLLKKMAEQSLKYYEVILK